MSLRYYKMKIRDTIVAYLERKVAQAPDRTLYFKRPVELTVWFFVNEDDRDFGERTICGLSGITMVRRGLVWPNDISGLGDVIKALLMFWFGRKKK